MLPAAPLAAVLSATLFLTACNRSQTTSSDTTTGAPGTNTGAANKKAYDAKGVIKAFGEGKKTVKIAHEDIPGYMKAMTMPFAVGNPAQIDGLKEGDAVSFSFTEESDGRMLIQSIKKQ